MTSPDPRTGPSATVGREATGEAVRDQVRDPVLAQQSREDTDAGWGEYPETSDERLYRDRPPHWDDF